ncbi:hypothetical protein ACGRL8_08495 [Vibrio rumoiensis]|uniref:hypothetical protein n=1 Tax=Vibrio rumoiensis TaxID=76258 RepID=UPI003748A95F
MSFSMSMDPTYYYLSDEVYWDWDAEQDVEGAFTAEQEIIMAEEVIFSKRFNSSEAYRTHHFFDILDSNMPYIATRYCRYEGLSKDYSEVAMQNNVLKDIIFIHAIDLSINFTLEHIVKLNDIVLNIYHNKNRKSVYNRVGTLQHFLHKCTAENGKKVESLDREVMRKLLSLSRLHIAISDIRKKNIDLIKDELLQNHLDLKKDSPSPYVVMLNRQYIHHWEKRHLKSLLHFCPQVERSTLKGLLNLKQPFNNDSVQEILFLRNK